MNKLKEFAEHVLREQLSHGEHGDAEYICMAQEALGNDTYNGFSNRETWAAVEVVGKFSHIGNLDTTKLKDVAEAWLTEKERLQIGSLWRVNWDEVATALKGERP